MIDSEDHFINARNYSSDLLKKMKDRTPEMVRKIAEIKKLDAEEAANLVFQNYQRLFL